MSKRAGLRSGGGNTSAAKQVAHWAFTYYGEDFKHDQTVLEYVVAQREICPTTKREHWQGYAKFKRSVRMKKAIELLGIDGAHMEPCAGKPSQNIAYCTKESSRKEGTEPYEWGKRPTDGKKGAQGKRSDLDNFVDFCEENEGKTLDYKEISRLFPCVFARYEKFAYEQFETYRIKVLKEKIIRTEMGRLNFICGKTGTGKTTYLVKNFNHADCYWKEPGMEWWEGYNGESTIVVNEWTNQKTCPIESLFTWCDIGMKTVNIKGRSKKLEARDFWITTNWGPEDILEAIDERNREALLRRCEFWEMVDFKLTKLKYKEKIEEKMSVKKLLESLASR